MFIPYDGIISTGQGFVVKDAGIGDITVNSTRNYIYPKIEGSMVTINLEF
jgi:hypothetical protein